MSAKGPGAAVRAVVVCVVVAAAALVTLVEGKPFDPAASSSFTAKNQNFAVSYADTSQLTGYVARERLALGEYNSMGGFGGARESKGTWRHDGIVGFGLRNVSDSLTPFPLMYSLTNTSHTGNLLKRNIFALALQSEKGELQLGGWEAESVAAEPQFVDVVKDEAGTFTKYYVTVGSFKMGAKTTSSSAMKCHVDSGASCLILPSVQHQRFQADFRTLQASKPTLTFDLGSGVEVEVPWDSYVDKDNKVCVTTVSDDPSYCSMGVPFFLGNVVVHDVTKSPPRLGFAKQKSGFTPAAKAGRVTLHSRDVQEAADTHRGMALEPRIRVASDVVAALRQETQGRRLEASESKQQVTSDSMQFFTVVGVGTPAQNMTVQVDTGSVWLAVFSAEPTNPGVVAAVVISCLAVVGAAVGIVLYRRGMCRKPEKDPMAFRAI